VAGFVLHGHFESGNCYKVALMLALCGEPYEYRHVALFDGATRMPDFRRLNRFEEIPVLEHDGRTICQSGVILRYLAEVLGRYGGEDLEARLRIDEWLAWENQRLLGGVALLRYIRRWQPHMAPEVVAFVEGRARRALDILSAALAGRLFLIGERATIADIAACAYLFWLDQAGLEAKRWPELEAWLSRLAALPGLSRAENLLPRQ